MLKFAFEEDTRRAQFAYLGVTLPCHCATFICLIGAICTFASNVCTLDNVNRTRQKLYNFYKSSNREHQWLSAAPILENCKWAILTNEHMDPHDHTHDELFEGNWAMLRHTLVARELRGKDFGTVEFGGVEYDSGHNFSAEASEGLSKVELDVESRDSQSSNTYDIRGKKNLRSFNSLSYEDTILFSDGTYLEEVWFALLFLWCVFKTIKLVGMAETLDPNLTSFPVRILEIVLGPDWYGRAKDKFGVVPALAVKCLSKGPEYVVLTWLPNLIILPLVSLATKDSHSNTAQMMFNFGTFSLMRNRCLGFLVYYFIVAFSTKCTGSRLISFLRTLARGQFLFLVLAGCTYWIYCLSKEFSFAFAFDFTVLANLAFSYDELIAWTSVLRLSVFFGTIIEICVTARVEFIAMVNLLAQKDCNDSQNEGASGHGISEFPVDPQVAPGGKHEASV